MMGRLVRTTRARDLLFVLVMTSLAIVSVRPPLAQAAQPTAAPVESPATYKDAKAPLEQRVEDLLARLTLKEKIALMAGGSAFAMHGVERLGIPELNLSDGPNGVRSNAGEATTVFPTGSALAATWDPVLLESVGQAIAREALAM